MTAEPATAAEANFDFGTGSIQRAADGFADRFDFDDVFFDHGIGRKRLDRVVLNAIPATGLDSTATA